MSLASDAGAAMAVPTAASRTVDDLRKPMLKDGGNFCAVVGEFWQGERLEACRFLGASEYKYFVCVPSVCLANDKRYQVSGADATILVAVNSLWLKSVCRLYMNH
jgi:hypothetical protein